MSKDYYKELGVQRGASQDEIDKAYRDLARKHHPDMNLDKEQEATERFKRISEAYEVLGNAEKRARYDFPSNGFFHSDIDNAFSQFFGDAGRSSMKGTRVRVSVTLREAFLGGLRKISIQQKKPCDGCQATGASRWQTCEVCGGAGMRSLHQAAFLLRTTCSACNGRGKIPAERCPQCSGQGCVKGEVEEVEVNIPSGIEGDTQIRIPDKGVNGSDLYVVVSVEDDKVFQRQGRNLLMNVCATYPQLVLGDKVNINGIDGTEIELKIKPGTQNGTRLRIKGQGMPAMNVPNTRGDLFAIISVKIPTEVNAEHKDLLEKLKKVE